MSDINENYYKIEGVLNLTQHCYGKLPKRLWLRRMALLENLNNYYRFAVSSVRLFQESSLKNLDLLSKQELQRDDFDDKSHSSALSFYSHARVCLESSKLLSEEGIFSSGDDEKVEFFQKHRDEYARWARDVIDKRNDIIAHPHNLRRMIVGPSGWGSNGKIRFNTVDLERIIISHDMYELDPASDLSELKKYLEKTIEHLTSIWVA